MKYAIIKVPDARKYLTPKQVDALDVLLDAIAEGRAKDGKPRANQYWVVNRDEPYADQVQRLIFKQPGMNTKKKFTVRGSKPVEGKNHRENVECAVACSSAMRAIELVLEHHPNLEVHQVHHYGRIDIIDDEVL